jgi:PLP dependent protein
MHLNVERLNLAKRKVKDIINLNNLGNKPEIIAITKKFQSSDIIPLIDADHIHFGENKIQEAEIKWNEIKKKYKNIKLHMVGKLQSNKAKKALILFDYIHSLDSSKLAKKLSSYEKELNKKIKYFIQINLGDEEQKSGILLSDLNNFYEYCTNDLSLNIIGLMCLPPIDSDVNIHFQTLSNLSKKLNLKDLSMGMSSDFEQATISGSTFLRLGTSIFGPRKY